MKAPRKTDRVYPGMNVHDAALARITRLYNEFPNVIINVSGGKDSTVVLGLALEVATKLGRLPVDALFIDQEAEWQSTVDLMRGYQQDDRIRLAWLQVPMRLFNATSTIEDSWLECWNPEKPEEWLRPKEPDSIHENVYGTDRFAALFVAYARHHHPNEPVASVTGMRADENLNRLTALTATAPYKDITWARADDKARGHFTFGPLYDWTTQDIWKAIHDYDWPYNAVYDRQYQHGTGLNNMRVSNLHHETALQSLATVQEAEPATWAALSQRLGSINTLKHIPEAYTIPKELPRAFESWEEYRDYLREHLITDPERRAQFERNWKRYSKNIYGGGQGR